MDKEVARIRTIKKGRKIKKVKMKAIDNNPKKKFRSIVFVCMFQL